MSIDPFNERNENLAKLPSIGGLTKAQTGWLIYLLAEYGIEQISIVKEDFNELFEHVKLSGDTVRQVASLYSDQIEQMANDFAAKIATNPIAKRSYRLQALWSLMKLAMKKDVVKGYWKVGIETYEENKLVNGKLAYDCLMAAEKIMADAERFEHEKAMDERRMFCAEVQAGVRNKNEKQMPGARSQKTKKSTQQEWMDSAAEDVSMGKIAKLPDANQK